MISVTELAQLKLSEHSVRSRAVGLTYRISVQESSVDEDIDEDGNNSCADAHGGRTFRRLTFDVHIDECVDSSIADEQPSSSMQQSSSVQHHNASRRHTLGPLHAQSPLHLTVPGYTQPARQRRIQPAQQHHMCVDTSTGHMQAAATPYPLQAHVFGVCVRV
jgi:hypothetical protein